MSTILVVDDMAVIREPVAAALRERGYQTMCAENGREALKAARANHPDLVLLEMTMPVMDGLACLKALRADAHLHDTPVIIMTALAERHSVIQAAKLGIAAYLLKSQFMLEETLDRVEQCIGPASGNQSGQPGRQAGSVDSRTVDRTTDLEPDFDAKAAAAPRDARSDSVEGLDDIRPGMSAAEIISQVGNSDELSALIDIDDADDGDAMERKRA
ncbi:MAG: response regulator [Phycisphaerales bacterium]|nr:response regulator [Phycisphaerales bacterium]